MIAVSYLSVLGAVTLLAFVTIAFIGLVYIFAGAIMEPEHRYTTMALSIGGLILLVTTFIWIGTNWQ